MSDTALEAIRCGRERDEVARDEVFSVLRPE